MLLLEKKKRTNSGSRSKSKKYKKNEYSVDLRSKQLASLPTETTKIKTENSSSLNKSKPSRKTSTKIQKKHTKSNNKEMKDPASYSVSAQRKQSLTKMQNFEVNLQNDDQIEKNMYRVMKKVKQIKYPEYNNIQILTNYYHAIKNCFQAVDGSLYTFCMELHSYYMHPLQPLLQLLSPYDDLIYKKEEIGKQIDQQIFQNQRLFEELSPTEIEIFKIKEKIQDNRAQIEKRRQKKFQQYQLKEQTMKEKEREKQKQKQKEKEQQKRVQRGQRVKSQAKQYDVRPEKIQHIGKGFRLDLQNINKEGQLGFHDEFYSNIEEFSQSWRNQALRQKRF